MEEKRHKLDNLKSQNPFRVPEGYIEGLTDRIMSQLPEKTSSEQKTPKASVMMRLRPWIAIAAAITGVAFFINVFIGFDKHSETLGSDSLWVQSDMPSAAISEARTNADDEYLEYLEAKYADYILEEELAYSE